MKFEIKDLRYGGIELYEKSDDDRLIRFGDIWLKKENYKNESYCIQYEDFFNYHGIKKALCGKESKEYGRMYFTPKRILVIQME